MSSHQSNQLGLGIQPPGGINFNTSGGDVAETYIDLPSGERAQQFNFSSDILTRDTGDNQGVLSGISDNTQVKTYLSNTGHLEVVLEGPSSEVGSTGSRSLWKNGEYQPGYADYISVGNQSAFENELKSVTLNEIKNRKSSNAEGVVYPPVLGISDPLQVDQLDQFAIAEAAFQNNTAAEGDTSFGAWRRGEEFNKLRQEEAKTTPTSPATPTQNFQFGKVDNIIKKLHLRNLIYPIDADFGNTQDYMQINQFKYRPPNQNLFFPKTAEEKTASGNDFNDIAIKGVPTASPQEEFLGLVKLPMPNSLADSNNVSWGADQLNALTAAVSSGVFGQVEGINDLVRNSIGRGLNFNNIKETAKEGGDLLNKAFSDAREGGASILDELKDQNSNISILGSTVVGSALLNILQFGVSPETILARGQGVVPNNNLALLFNSPTLREFTFTWKMTPRSREEATRVNNIIRFFKQGMAPKKGIDTSTGGGSYFLGTPNVFDIAFKTTTDGGNFFFEGDDRNNSVVRIKTCACTGTAINYTPDGMWNAYDRGQPVSVTMSLRFAELEPIFDTDYDENVFNYDPNRKDLHPVPIDAVGY